MLQATYEKLLTEVPKYKMITPSVLSDRLRVSSPRDGCVGVQWQGRWLLLLLVVMGGVAGGTLAQCQMGQRRWGSGSQGGLGACLRRSVGATWLGVLGSRQQSL